MTDIIEAEQWEAGIYQLETDDPVLGGEDGIDNLQAKQLANRTQWLKAQLLLRALIESPAFTGTPTVPTAAPGTNTTQVANTAFTKAAIDAAIAGLIDSSPGALDTLNELAAALGNDPNFATTITNALALKAPWSTIDEVITEAGMIPDHGVLTQLRDAIQAMITASLSPDASETVKGIIEIATAAEAQALTDDVRALTALKLAAVLDITALGRNQTWQNVTGSRTTNVTYTNSTGQPIQVSVTALTDGTTGNGLSFSVNGVEIIFEGVVTLINRYSTMLIVPPGATYRVTGKPGTAIEKWFELRN